MSAVPFGGDTLLIPFDGMPAGAVPVGSGVARLRPRGMLVRGRAWPTLEEDGGADGAVVLVQSRRGGGGGFRLWQMPGGGFREVTPAEELLLERFYRALETIRRAEPNNREGTFVVAPGTVPGEDWVLRLEGEVRAIEGRVRRVDTENTEARGLAEPEGSESVRHSELPSVLNRGSATVQRDTPGIASVSSPLEPASSTWLQKGYGRVPAEIANRMDGRLFTTFDEFRAAFWREVASMPELAAQFNRSNLMRMREGRAPRVPENGVYGKRAPYILHHVMPVGRGGQVYDMSNILIVTPKVHEEVLPPDFHFGRQR